MANQDEFGRLWDRLSADFEKESLGFNALHQDYALQMRLSFEIIVDKLGSPLGHAGVEERPDQVKQLSSFKKKGNDFAEFWVDYQLFKLKNVRKSESNDLYPPFRELRESERPVKPDETTLVSELLLVCFVQNQRFVKDRKLYRMSVKLSEVFNKALVFEFFVHYFFAIEVQKDKLLDFNFAMTETLENWTLINVHGLVDQGRLSPLFKVLWLLFGILCAQKQTNGSHFSNRFLRGLAKMQLWLNVEFWDSAFLNLVECLKCDECSFACDFFRKDGRKRRLKDPALALEALLQLQVIFLRLSVSTSLDIANQLNQRHKVVSLETLKRLSFDFESKWIEVQKSSLVSFSDRVVAAVEPQLRKEKVLKMALPYLRNDKSCFALMLANKSFYSSFRPGVLKQVLLKDGVEAETSKRIWVELAARQSRFEQEGLTRSKLLQQANPRTADLIRMDVRRTNFAKFFEEPLERLLNDVSVSFPSVNYYQGMNCIGGFLLNYFDDYDKSDSVFRMLVKRRLARFFSKNFENVPKLIYLCGRVMRKFLPRLSAHLDGLLIDSGLYISPFFFTIYTCFLQHFHSYRLVAKVFDMFIASGWVGFFKVMVVIMSQVEERLLKKNYEQVLLFLNRDIYEFLFKMKNDSFKRQCEKVQLTRGAVEQFALDFDRSRIVLEKYWSNLEKRNKQEELGAEGGKFLFNEVRHRGSGDWAGDSLKEGSLFDQGTLVEGSLHKEHASSHSSPFIQELQARLDSQPIEAQVPFPESTKSPDHLSTTDRPLARTEESLGKENKEGNDCHSDNPPKEDNSVRQ